MGVLDEGPTVAVPPAKSRYDAAWFKPPPVLLRPGRVDGKGTSGDGEGEIDGTNEEG